MECLRATSQFCVLAICAWRLLAPLPSRGEAPAIHLRSRTIEPAAAGAGSGAAVAQAARAVLAAVRAGDEDPARVLVQLAAIPDLEACARLARHGLTLGGYVPEHAFLAALHPGADPDTLASLGVVWLGPLLPADRVAPALAGGMIPTHARLDGGAAALFVEFHPDVPLGAGIARAREGADARLLAEVQALNAGVFAVAADRIPDLAALTAVKWVEPASPRFADLNNEVRRVIGADSAQAPPIALSGDGVTVLVYDGGLVCATHADLAPRVVNGEGGVAATHATHVAGTLGGSGGSSGGLYRGVAPAVGIVSYRYAGCDPVCLYNNPQDLADDYGEAIAVHAADFATNSIGANIVANGYDCDFLGDYEHTARLIDAIAAGALGRPFLSFWAAGNERAGSAVCGSSYYTMGVPAGAKSAIVVGAVASDTQEIASFSSLGPVDDGRMRPDLVAPGCEIGGDHGVTSTRSCIGHTVYCGTSMATPAAAGAAALVHERLASVQRGPLTLPAATKAILACSAIDVGNAGPDYTSGYGLVDVVAAVGIADQGMIVEESVAHGETVSRRIDVPAGRTRLRAVLAWDDPPGEPLVLPSLVNDLDLRLVDPAGGVHLPFVLDPLFPEREAARGTNQRDPSEMVEVIAPIPGRWRLDVIGVTVPAGPQTFALVADAPPAEPVAIGGGNAAPGAGASLAQNVPNPFNPSTAIRFTLAGSALQEISLTIFDLCGRQLRSLVAGPLPAGEHVVVWDGRDGEGRRVASGVYVYELVQGGRREARRMVLVK